MCFEPRDYLRHILAEADYLTNQSAGLTADKFMADDTLRRASSAVWRSSEKQRRRSLPRVQGRREARGSKLPFRSEWH
jgi:hypothetical protein